jgi:hypothetical protein
VLASGLRLCKKGTGFRLGTDAPCGIGRTPAGVGGTLPIERPNEEAIFEMALAIRGKNGWPKNEFGSANEE